MEVDTNSPTGLPNFVPFFIDSADKLESYIFFKHENIEIIHRFSHYHRIQNLESMYLKNIPHINIFLR